MNSAPKEPTTGTTTGALWLPLSEAAARAGVSIRAMQKRAAAGKIGAQKIGDGAAARWEIDARELASIGREPDASQDANREPLGRVPNANSNDFERETGREPRTLGRVRDASRDANREPIGREREAELKEEIAFLRGLVEQRDRDAAELRAALREALRAMPKQLSAAPLDAATAPTRAASGASAERDAPASSDAPTPEQFKPPDKATGAEKHAAPNKARAMRRSITGRILKHFNLG